MHITMEDYSLVKQIGKGSYGKVWLIKKNHSNKQYVLKQIDMHNASKQEQCSAHIEIKLLSSLKHPNIVSYYNSFQQQNGILHIIMGYCENGDMYTFIRSRKGLLFPEKQIVEWFVQICMALQYLHDRHILHRDLKTQNIFLTKTKLIKVGDLGIARVLDSTCDLATTLIGTPYYMSPELFANQPYNQKSDIWALGCCLYEMATLKHAFNARDLTSLMYKVLLGKLPVMPKQYSAELVDLMRTMLNYDANCRPTIKCILQNDYVRRHIMDFLKETTNRCKTSSNRHEKCNPLVPNFPTHKNFEDINTKPIIIQSKPSCPAVSKYKKNTITQKTCECLKCDSNNINHPTSSRTQFSGPNKKFEIGKIENCDNDKAQLISNNVNKPDDISVDFSKFSTDIKNGKINDKLIVVYNEDSTLHHVGAQDSEKEKAEITPPRRRRRKKWQRAHSGDTSNCHNPYNECNNYRKNTNACPLQQEPSQLVVHSLDDVNITFHKREHYDAHIHNFQPNKFVEQDKVLPITVYSQDDHVMSKNSEARRRRREKLQHQRLSTSKSDKIIAKQGEATCNQFECTIEEMENKEKIDKEFQEFIGILDNTLQLEDKSNEKQQLTSEEMDKECKYKTTETIADSASGNQENLIRRRDLLIKDCSLALGDKLLKKVLDKVDYTISDTDLQARLLHLLGKEHLEAYGGKLIQLKIYQDAIAAR